MQDILLIHKGIDKPRAFTAEHAKRLMTMKNNGGWEFADSKQEALMEKQLSDATNDDTNSGTAEAAEGSSGKAKSSKASK